MDRGQLFLYGNVISTTSLICPRLLRCNFSYGNMISVIGDVADDRKTQRDVSDQYNIALRACFCIAHFAERQVKMGRSPAVTIIWKRSVEMDKGCVADCYDYMETRLKYFWAVGGTRRELVGVEITGQASWKNDVD